MALFNNNLAVSYRNYSAATTAIGLTVLLIWILTLDEEAALVSRAKTSATVTKVVMNPNFATSGTIGLQLSNNKVVEIYTTLNPFPVIGDTLSIVIESYDNDRARYIIDRRKWFDQQIYK